MCCYAPPPEFTRFTFRITNTTFAGGGLGCGAICAAQHCGLGGAGSSGFRVCFLHIFSSASWEDWGSELLTRGDEKDALVKLRLAAEAVGYCSLCTQAEHGSMESLSESLQRPCFAVLGSRVRSFPFDFFPPCRECSAAAVDPVRSTRRWPVHCAVPALSGEPHEGQEGRQITELPAHRPASCFVWLPRFTPVTRRSASESARCAPSKCYKLVEGWGLGLEG